MSNRSPYSNRARIHAVLLFAALGGILLHAGCRAIEGLDAFPFDLNPDATPPGSDGCVVPPSGWSGPIIFYEGSPRSTPKCPSAYPFQIVRGGTGLEVPAKGCSDCTCAPTTATCIPGSLQPFGKPTCKGAKDPVGVSEQCTVVSGNGYIEDAPRVSADPCDADGGAVVPLGWTYEGVACATSAEGSSFTDGGACPAVPAPFVSRRCVVASASTALPCPPEFSEPHVWETVADGRGCTPCTCGDPVLPPCTVTTRSYGDATCGTVLLSSNTVGDCVDQPGMGSVNSVWRVSGMASCLPGGGVSTGSVIQAPVVTICCP